MKSIVANAQKYKTIAIKNFLRLIVTNQLPKKVMCSLENKKIVNPTVSIYVSFPLSSNADNFLFIISHLPPHNNLCVSNV